MVGFPPEFDSLDQMGEGDLDRLIFDFCVRSLCPSNTDRSPFGAEHGLSCSQTAFLGQTEHFSLSFTPVPHGLLLRFLVELVVLFEPNDAARLKSEPVTHCLRPSQGLKWPFLNGA